MNRSFANPDAWRGHDNPYDEPDKCGLTIVGTLEDPGACYSFDTVVVWQDNVTGNLYAAHDSGCSCPSPFEDFKSLADLTYVPNLDALDYVIGEAYCQYPLAEVEALRRKVQALLDWTRPQIIVPVGQYVQELTVGSDREAELVDSLTAYERELSNARDRITDLLELNTNYLTVIREQGEFIQFIKESIAAFRSGEMKGRFS